MKEFLYDMLIEPFTDNEAMGYIMGVIGWIIFLTLSFFLFIFLYWIIDSSFMPIQEKDGVVIGTKYSPAHSSTTYIHVGDVLVPNTVYYDESFYVVIEIDGLKDDVEVYEGYYNSVEKGTKVHCKYTNGRIGDNLYIKSFE